MIRETDTQIRLRRAKEALAHAIDKADEARRALAIAEETRRSAKEKYEELFRKWDQEEFDRKMSEYNHCTK